MVLLLHVVRQVGVRHRHDLHGCARADDKEQAAGLQAHILDVGIGFPVQSGDVFRRSLVLNQAAAEDITTLDGKTYADVQDVSLKPGGLFFVVGAGTAMKVMTVPYANLPDDVKEKHHYDP